MEFKKEAAHVDGFSCSVEDKTCFSTGGFLFSGGLKREHRAVMG